MTSLEQPRILGAGLVALDLVMGADPESPVRAWAGGTCGNVLSILAFLGWDAYPIARMNGDSASQRVRADMARWGVRLELAGCAPTTHTPIIIQEIRRDRNGLPKHRFSWSCPRCGHCLPGFKAITGAAVETVAPILPGASVFFLDRLSRATLSLAALATAEGAVVVFEPSGKADSKLFADALRVAHVVKYSEQRLASIPDVFQNSTATLIEIQTMGPRGLKFRHRLDQRASEWMLLDAIPAARLVDTCGAGDWCTAGLLAKAAEGGQTGLRRVGAEGVETALRYGQALAAWNCAFEGARGGMYAVERETFKRQIEALMAGQQWTVAGTSPRQTQDAVVECPACPPAELRRDRWQ